MDVQQQSIRALTADQYTNLRNRFAGTPVSGQALQYVTAQIYMCTCMLTMNKHFDAFISLTALEFHLVIVLGNSANCV